MEHHRLSHLFPNTTSFSLRIGEEVVINDTVYHEVLQSNDSLNTDWVVLNQYLREDILHRIYMRSINSTEQVLYDFSLTTGDTFFTENQCHVTVLETDSITLNNGDVRKLGLVTSILFLVPNPAPIV